MRDKAFNVAKNPNNDGYQRGLASMIYKFFDKKSKGSGVNIGLERSEQLAKELHKPFSRNFKKKSSLFWIQRQYFGCWFNFYAVNKQF